MEQTNEELEVVKVDDDEINCEEKLREINGVNTDSQETKTATDITTTKVRFVSFIALLSYNKLRAGGIGWAGKAFANPILRKHKRLVIPFLTSTVLVLAHLNFSCFHRP